MNRQQRRAAAKAGRTDPQAVQYANSYRCPDCDSTQRLEVDEYGIHHLHVFHADTCPRLNGVTS